MKPQFTVKLSGRKTPSSAYSAAEEAAMEALERFVPPEQNKPLCELIQEWADDLGNSERDDNNLHHLQYYRKEMIQDAVMPLIIEGWPPHADSENLFQLIGLDYADHAIETLEASMRDYAKAAFDKSLSQQASAHKA